MAFYTGEFVEVYIDGTERTEYVVSYQRVSSMCDLGDTFIINLDPNCPLPDPYDPIRIVEKYGGSSGTVLRGYIQTVEKTHETGLITINGQDKSIRLQDYFIADQLYSTGQTVDYWMSYICGLAGLDVTFEATCGGIIVEDGTPLGMTTAAQLVLTLERLAAYYTRYDSEEDKIVIYRLKSSEPLDTISTTDTSRAQREMGTEKTRNVVKVYGGWAFDWVNQVTYQVFSQARSDIPGLLTDKTLVMANPLIRRQTYAYIVADRLLNVVSSIDDVHTYDCPGFFPGITVSKYLYFSINKGHYTYYADRYVTTIQTVVDENGVITTFVIGEKCPRISIQLPVPPIYVTDTEDGVGVSWTGGDSFQLSNAGLTTSAEKYGFNIAVNSYGQQMVVTAAGLYRRYGSQATWTGPITLPDPINTSNDPSPVTVSGITLVRVVDAPTIYNAFHLLVSGIIPSGEILDEDLHRAWVYSTDDFGLTWTSLQLYVPAPSGGYKEHGDAPFGNIYNVWAHDLQGNIDNKCFTLVTAISDFVPTPNSIYVMRRNAGYLNRSDYGYFESGGIFDYDFTYMPGAIRCSRIYSLPGNESVAYAVIASLEGASTNYRGCHTRIFRTKDSGVTWTQIQDGVLLSAYLDNDANPYNHVIHFDHASTSTEARIVITCWKRIDTSTARVYARWIEDDSEAEDTTVTDTNQDITLDWPSLDAGEVFNGYIADSDYNAPDGASVNARTHYISGTNNYGYTHGGGYYGALLGPGPTTIGTVQCYPFVSLKFSSHTITRVNCLVNKYYGYNPLYGHTKGHGYTLSADQDENIYPFVTYPGETYRVNSTSITSLYDPGTAFGGSESGNYQVDDTDDILQHINTGFPDYDDEVWWMNGNSQEVDWRPMDGDVGRRCPILKLEPYGQYYYTGLHYHEGIPNFGFYISDADGLVWTELFDTAGDLNPDNNILAMACFDWRTWEA